MFFWQKHGIELLNTKFYVGMQVNESSSQGEMQNTSNGNFLSGEMDYNTTYEL